MTEKSAYTVEFVTGDDQIARISRLFEKNGNPKKIEHLLWQYKNPPAGPAITAFAISPEGQDAAVYSVFPVRAFVAGRETLIAQSLDTLTDVNHRGKGLFSKLANEVFRFSSEIGIEKVYGFPNSSSAPGFFGRLGWKEMGYPPFVLHLSNLMFPFRRLFNIQVPRLENYWQKIKTRSLSSSFASHNSIEFSDESSVAEDDLRDVCNSFISGLTNGVIRDSNYFLWRYSRPGANYIFCCAWEKGKLKGVVVCRATDKHGGRIGYIMDLIVDPTDRELAHQLLRQATQRLYVDGVDVILGWSGRKSLFGDVFRSSGFFGLHRNLQPIKLFFGVKSLRHLSQSVQADDMFLSYADSDTV